MPAFVFAGFANTGKTTYLCRLVPALQALGLRVAIIKDGHDLVFDSPGTDTDRFMKAGAETVAVCADEMSLIMTPGRRPLADMLAKIEADVVLLEGFKTEPYPQIGLYRAAANQPLTAPPSRYIALVTDSPTNTDTPQFPLDDPAPLARFLAERIRTTT